MSHHKSFSTNHSDQSTTTLPTSASEIQPDSRPLSNMEVLGGGGEFGYTGRKRLSSQKRFDRSRATIFNPVRTAAASRFDEDGSRNKRTNRSKSRRAAIKRGLSTGSSSNSSTESSDADLSDSPSLPTSGIDAEESPDYYLSDEPSESSSEESLTSSDSNSDISSQEVDRQDEDPSAKEHSALTTEQREKRRFFTQAIYLRVPSTTSQKMQWKVLRKLRSKYPGALVVLDDSEAQTSFSQRTSFALLWQWIQDGRIDYVLIARLDHICKSTEALRLFEWMCEGYGVHLRLQPSLELALNDAPRE